MPVGFNGLNTIANCIMVFVGSALPYILGMTSLDSSGDTAAMLAGGFFAAPQIGNFLSGFLGKDSSGILGFIGTTATLQLMKGTILDLVTKMIITCFASLPYSFCISIIIGILVTLTAVVIGGDMVYIDIDIYESFYIEILLLYDELTEPKSKDWLNQIITTELAIPVNGEEGTPHKKLCNDSK